MNKYLVVLGAKDYKMTYQGHKHVEAESPKEAVRKAIGIPAYEQALIVVKLGEDSKVFKPVRIPQKVRYKEV